MKKLIKKLAIALLSASLLVGAMPIFANVTNTNQIDFRYILNHAQITNMGQLNGTEKGDDLVIHYSLDTDCEFNRIVLYKDEFIEIPESNYTVDKVAQTITIKNVQVDTLTINIMATIDDWENPKYPDFTNFTLYNVYAQCPKDMEFGKDYSFKLIPNEGYRLPIEVGLAQMEDSYENYTYDWNTGIVTLPNFDPNEMFEFFCRGAEKVVNTEFKVDFELENVYLTKEPVYKFESDGTYTCGIEFETNDYCYYPNYAIATTTFADGQVRRNNGYVQKMEKQSNSISFDKQDILQDAHQSSYSTYIIYNETVNADNQTQVYYPSAENGYKTSLGAKKHGKLTVKYITGDTVIKISTDKVEGMVPVEPPVMEPPIVEPKITETIQPTEINMEKEHNLSFILEYHEWLKNKKNQAYKMDVLPAIIDSKYYVPLRFLSYSLNVPTQNVKWDNTTKTATIILNDKTYTQKVGDDFVMVDGVKHNITQKAYLNRGRVLIPIKDFAKLMITEAYDIYYNPQSGECIIIYKDDTVTDHTQYILLPDTF